MEQTIDCGERKLVRYLAATSGGLRHQAQDISAELPVDERERVEMWKATRGCSNFLVADDDDLNDLDDDDDDDEDDGGGDDNDRATCECRSLSL